MPDDPPSAIRLTLDGALVLREIDGLHGRLRDALSRHAAVELDCSGAADIDMSVVQLLVAARRTAEASGRRLALVGTAPASSLATILARAGFLDAAGRPAGADAAWLVGTDMP